MSTEASANQQGNYVQANGVEIYYEEYGIGKPLLLLHGGTLTSRSWQAHATEFAQHYHVITPDSRGHGRTKNPTGEFSYRLMADDMAAFIQAVGMYKPLICGFSDGAQIALEISMRYPELAEAHVLVGVCYKLSEKYRKTFTDWGILGAGMVDLAQVQQATPKLVQRWQTEHATIGGAHYWQTLLTQISVMWWTPFAYTAQDFRQITAPTLIVLGDRDDFVPVEEAVELYRLIPHAELAIFPHGTHGGVLAGQTGINPLFMNIVSDFFTRHRTQS